MDVLKYQIWIKCDWVSCVYSWNMSLQITYLHTTTDILTWCVCPCTH